MNIAAKDKRKTSEIYRPVTPKTTVLKKGDNNNNKTPKKKQENEKYNDNSKKRKTNQTNPREIKTGSSRFISLCSFSLIFNT